MIEHRRLADAGPGQALARYIGTRGVLGQLPESIPQLPDPHWLSLRSRQRLVDRPGPRPPMSGVEELPKLRPAGRAGRQARSSRSKAGYGLRTERSQHPGHAYR
ncbi:MAG: hypothetical protein U5R48_01285 [Gammaproteobacteria bacterium]|nr:hypothetical protein [Gammaproteobacteria bacterium]